MTLHTIAYDGRNAAVLDEPGRVNLDDFTRVRVVNRPVLHRQGSESRTDWWGYDPITIGLTVYPLGRITYRCGH